MARPPGLLYAVDETPPPITLIIAALQQVAVMSNSLIYPIILAREAGLSANDLLDFASVAMLILGVATILLCMRSRYAGSGYLCPAGFTQIYLGPSLLALQRGGLALVFGMTISAGLLQVAIAPLLRRMRMLLPPEIAGLVISVVGLSIAVVGVRYGLSIIGDQGIRPIYLVIAGITLATMIVLNIWTKGFARMFCVLIGMGVGYAVSAVVGVLDLSAAVPAGGLDFVRLPHFRFIQVRFDLTELAPFVIVALAGTLHLMGNVSTAQRINDDDWIRPDFRSLTGGLAGNGIAAVLCGLVGSLGINSYTSCIGVSTATGITSRSVAYAVGIIFALLALVPSAAIVVATIPAPVVGAAMFFTAAFVFTSGLQMITARMLDSRKTIVIGLSFGAAAMADIYHGVFATAPLFLQPVLGDGLVMGTTCGVLLNLVTQIGIHQLASIRLDPGHISHEAVEKFLAEQGAHWAARRDIINRATFGVVQLLELLGDAPGGIELEARFDEFNLDLRVRYIGAPLTFPERRPSAREILESVEGERLLAGHLLCRSADRISSRALSEGAEVHLHYDH
jgi:NCS2 family nucleobase:cation symporter-2